MATTTGARNRSLIVVGITAIAVAVVVAAALWFAAGQRLRSAVDSLAPAPVGCDTTLTFDESGTYYVYAETSGSVDELDGDCENDDQVYRGGATDLDVALFDAGDEIELEESDDITYSAGSSKGKSLYSIDIQDTGDYVLRVQGGDDDVVARVGGDPNGGVGALRTGSVISVIVGLAIGAVFLSLGLRRRDEPAVPDDGGSGPRAGWQPPPSLGPTPPPLGPPLNHGPATSMPRPPQTPLPAPPPPPGDRPAPDWGPPGS